MASFKSTYKALAAEPVIEKLQLLLVLLFTCTLALNSRLNSIFLFITLFSFAFTFRAADFIKYKKHILLFTACYIFSWLALTYSSNIHEGKLVLERQLSLLFVPLLFFTCFRITPAKFKAITEIFFFSIVCVCIYLLCWSAQLFFKSNVTIEKWFVRDNLYHAFAKPVEMHATYLSLYVAMAIFLSFNKFLSSDGWWSKLLIFIAALILVTTLTLLSSRVVISSVVFILFFIYPFFTWQRKHKFLLLIASLAVLFILFFVMRESNFIKNRFIEKAGDEIKMTHFLDADTSYNPIYGGETRADRWYCAAELIKEKPVFGYGTGSEKDELMKKYIKYNLQNAVINHYDAHNQYLAYAIKGGIFGLLSFILLIIYALYIAVKNKSFLYLSFILLFAVACITENVLESNKGIFFFVFFNTLLSFNFLSENKLLRDKSIKLP